MKLALMALAIEISLARVFVSSWGWAAAFVVLYCTLVFVYMSRKVWLSRKQNTQGMKSESSIFQGYVNSNTKRERHYNMYAHIDALQEN